MGTRRVHTVLVVDDDVRLRAALERSLSRRGRRALSAGDAHAALALAATHEPQLAIVDLRLGNESGIELVAELKRRWPGLLVALISGYLSIDVAVAATRAGADAVMHKPVTLEEILTRIEDNDRPRPLGAGFTATLARAEWEHISRVMLDADNNISLAARRLGVHRSTLQRRLRKDPPQR